MTRPSLMILNGIFFILTIAAWPCLAQTAVQAAKAPAANPSVASSQPIQPQPAPAAVKPDAAKTLNLQSAAGPVAIPAPTTAAKGVTNTGATSAYAGLQTGSGVSDKDYVEPTYQDMSKLYWALAMFDLSDNAAIDGFLMINECELYRKYYNSDFDLEGLREATRQSITKQLATYPMRYDIMIPIGLNRYNIGTEKFTVDPKSQYVGSKRLEIVTSDYDPDACGQIVNAPKYPRNFILSLSRPLTLTEVYVSPEVAQFYIEQSEKEEKSADKFALSDMYRIAFLRLKVTINQFRGYHEMESGIYSADLFGTIDAYEIYADRDKTLLMFNEEMAKKREKRNGMQNAQLPSSGPLMQTTDPALVPQNPAQTSQSDDTESRNLPIPGVDIPATLSTPPAKKK